MLYSCLYSGDDSLYNGEEMTACYIHVHHTEIHIAME
jgi:hypothetical protein